MTLTEVRNLFPHLKTNRIYFNHAAIGPISDHVKSILHQYLEERSSGQIEDYQRFLDIASSAKKRLAGILNANKTRLVWTNNVSSGINILAQGLSWQSGDRIILNDLEFPSNVYPFMNLKNQGVEIDFAKSKNGKIDVEDYEELITPKTKLISISLVQFLTGYKADINALGELCKSKNIILSVDAIQAAGVINIDVENWGIDFLAGGTHKWLMSLQGLGYAYISDQLQEKIDQKYVGWLSVDDDWNLLNYDLTLKPNASRYQLGTSTAIGITALNASLEIFKNFGMENVEKRILENTRYFIHKLLENGYEPLLKEASKQNLAGITSVRFEDSQKVFDELNSRDINAAMREGIVRFAPHYYNTKDEIDLVIEAINQVHNK